MDITIKDDLKQISLPFPSFKPNTVILSEQINDNNDEIQYRTNLLLKSFLKHVDQNIELEGLHDALREEHDNYINDNNQRVLELEQEVDKDREDINKRVDNEVKTLNKKIDNHKSEINKRVDNEVKTLNEKIINKADSLELKNTLLYLKSGDRNISVADLSSLGGNIGKRSTYLASGHQVMKEDWTLGEDGLYSIVLNHNLSTSVPQVVFYDDATNQNVFNVTELIDANNVRVYTDNPVNAYIVAMDATGNVNIVQAILDDEQVTNLRTWSSEKIKKEIDNKTVDLTPITSDLGKTENTKYSTENGIKEFECKDGYVDNVYMEGETLVNLYTTSYIGSQSSVFISYQMDSFEVGKTYTIYVAPLDNIQTCVAETNGLNYLLNYMPNNDFGCQTFIATATSLKIYYKTLDGTSPTENINKVVILEGDHTDKPISYFKGLKSVGQGDKIEVLTYNKTNNLIEDTFTYTKDMVVNYINGELRSATGHYACDNYIEIEPSTDYMFVGINGNRAYYDENKQVVPPINNSYLQVLLDKTNGSKKNFTVEKSPSNARYIKITIHKDNLVGGKAYLYKSSNYDHKQISTTLRSLPNGVKDTIEKIGNKYVKVQRCGEVVLNGSNGNISLDSQVNDTTIKPLITEAINDAKVGGVNNNNLNIYCDKFKAKNIHSPSNTDEGIYYSGGLNIHIRVLKSRLSTQDVKGFKTWLSSNPITVVYELETPQIIELPNFNPQTYSDSTTLLLNSGVIQGECNFEVTNSIGSEIEVLKEKVSDINDTSFDNKKTLNDLLSTEKGSFVRSYECFKNISTANKWFTIFESAVMPDSQFTDFNLSGGAYILTVNRSYTSPSNESYVFLINCAFERVNITQLSGTTQGQLLQKIRLVTRTPNKTFKIEIYIKDNPTYENFWTAKIIPISRSNDLYVNLNPRNFIESDNLGVTRKEYTVTPNGVVTFGLEEIQTLQLENEELKKQNNLILSNQRAILAGDMQTLAYNLYPEDFAEL